MISIKMLGFDIFLDIWSVKVFGGPVSGKEMEYNSWGEGGVGSVGCRTSRAFPAKFAGCCIWGEGGLKKMDGVF